MLYPFLFLTLYYSLYAYCMGSVVNETLQFLLFLLGREQTQILWKRVSNIHL